MRRAASRQTGRRKHVQRQVTNPYVVKPRLESTPPDSGFTRVPHKLPGRLVRRLRFDAGNARRRVPARARCLANPPLCDHLSAVVWRSCYAPQRPEMHAFVVRRMAVGWCAPADGLGPIAIEGGRRGHPPCRSHVRFSRSPLKVDSSYCTAPPARSTQRWRRSGIVVDAATGMAQARSDQIQLWPRGQSRASQTYHERRAIRRCPGNPLGETEMLSQPRAPLAVHPSAG